MKTLKFLDRESWLEARKGKITGTRLKDIVVLKGTGQKKGYYELIAEKVALPATSENPMERGSRLEPEALETFEKETGKKVKKDLVLWVSDENEDIALSPDGVIGKNEAVDAKCLNSASHIEAWITKQIPKDYEFQKLQYFIVNPKLKTLYFAFYDPRVLPKPFFFLTFERKDLEEDIATYLAYQKDLLKKVEEEVLKLTF